MKNDTARKRGMNMAKIALAGIATVLCALFVRGGKSEYASFISMAGCLLLFFFGVSRLETILRTIDRLKEYLGGNTQYVAILLKIVGITYLSEFASDLCRDAGFSAVGSQVELAGKLTIMAVSLPILLALVELIEGFLT